MFKLKDLLNEALPTREIDPSQFPNPVTGAMKKIFLNKGEQDGDPTDDIVQTQDVSLPAAKLKASQDAIYLGRIKDWRFDSSFEIIRRCIWK
jgi:hypothetical protein